jgi:hypothetical protein
MAVMRCKFKMNEVSIVSSNPKGVRVKMGAVYSSEYAGSGDKADENAIFGKYTPHGAFEATIYNDNLYDTLIASVGKFFYLDFTEAS